MLPSLWDVTLHLLAALAAGAFIGTERSFHGRFAGFRTHTLVCLTSSLLMLLTLYEGRWFPGAAEGVRIDPTRVAQGIMTGIGFLGAGVIFKEGLSVRGLTTAASIWITAAIGILMGAGLYAAGWIGTALTFGVLSAFRRIETRFPTRLFAHHIVRFKRGEVMPEPALRALLAGHGFAVASVSYAVNDADQVFEYRMAIHAVHGGDLGGLAHALDALPQVRGFVIDLSGD